MTATDIQNLANTNIMVINKNAADAEKNNRSMPRSMEIAIMFSTAQQRGMKPETNLFAMLKAPQF